jgi:hypothetical protein
MLPRHLDGGPVRGERVHGGAPVGRPAVTPRSPRTAAVRLEAYALRSPRSLRPVSATNASTARSSPRSRRGNGRQSRAAGPAAVAICGTAPIRTSPRAQPLAPSRSRRTRRASRPHPPTGRPPRAASPPSGAATRSFPRLPARAPPCGGDHTRSSAPTPGADLPHEPGPRACRPPFTVTVSGLRRPRLRLRLDEFALEVQY